MYLAIPTVHFCSNMGYTLNRRNVAFSPVEKARADHKNTLLLNVVGLFVIPLCLYFGLNFFDAYFYRNPKVIPREEVVNLTFSWPLFQKYVHVKCDDKVQLSYSIYTTKDSKRQFFDYYVCRAGSKGIIFKHERSRPSKYIGIGRIFMLDTGIKGDLDSLLKEVDMEGVKITDVMLDDTRFDQVGIFVVGLVVLLILVNLFYLLRSSLFLLFGLDINKTFLVKEPK